MKFKQNSWHYDEDDSYASFEKRHKNKDRERSSEHLRLQYKAQKEHGFTCIQCGFPVTADRECSGVNNRNHCPRCLYSRHVDEYKAGDRKAECRSRMQPIGLTIKHTVKRYHQELQGELMLIHRCTGCGKISINRIAADDDAARIYQLFSLSTEFTAEDLSSFDMQGILPLGKGDMTRVYSQLFGWQSILEEFENHDVQRPELMPMPDELEIDVNERQLKD